jgi:myo-inositol catabolism protein IolC
VETREQWELIDRVLDKHDSECRIIILGKGASVEDMEKGIKIAKSSRYVNGFAIGSTIFWDSWMQLLRNEIELSQVPDLIDRRYTQLVQKWRE